MSTSTTDSLFLQGDGTPLRIYIDPAELPLARRSAVIKSIRKCGGTLALLPRDANIILVVRGTADAQVYASSSSGKVVLDYEWAKHCVESGRVVGKEDDWGGFRIVAMDGDAGDGYEDLIAQESGGSESDDAPAQTSKPRAVPPRNSSTSGPSRSPPKAPKVQTPNAVAAAPSVARRPLLPSNQSSASTPSLAPVVPPSPAKPSTSGNVPSKDRHPPRPPIPASATDSTSPEGTTKPVSPYDQLVPQGMFPIALLPPQLLAQLYAQAAAVAGGSSIPIPGMPNMPADTSQLSAALSGFVQANPSISAVIPVPRSSSSTAPSRQQTSSSYLPTPTSPRSTGLLPSPAPSLPPMSHTPTESKPANLGFRRSVTASGKLFISPSGEPLKIYIPVDVKDRGTLMRSVKSNGGSLSKMYECDYALLAPENAVKLLPTVTGAGKIALWVDWVDDSIAQGTLLPEEEYRVDADELDKDESSAPVGGATASTPSWSRNDRVDSHSSATPSATGPAENGAPHASLRPSSASLTKKTTLRAADATRALPDVMKSETGTSQPTLLPLPTEKVPGPKGFLYTDDEEAYFVRYANLRFAEDPQLSIFDIVREVAEKLSHHSYASWRTHYTRHLAWFDARIQFPKRQEVKQERNSEVPGATVRSSPAASDSGTPPPAQPVAARAVKGSKGFNKFTPEDEAYFLEYVRWMRRKDAYCSIHTICRALGDQPERHHTYNSWMDWYKRHKERLEPILDGDDAHSSSDSATTRDVIHVKSLKRESLQPRPREINGPPDPPTYRQWNHNGHAEYPPEDMDYVKSFVQWTRGNDGDVSATAIARELGARAPYHTENGWLGFIKRNTAEVNGVMKVEEETVSSRTSRKRPRTSPGEERRPQSDSLDDQGKPRPPSKRIRHNNGHYRFTDEDEQYIIKYAQWRLERAPGVSMNDILREISQNTSHHTEQSWSQHYHGQEPFYIRHIFGADSPEMARYYEEEREAQTLGDDDGANGAEIEIDASSEENESSDMNGPKTTASDLRRELIEHAKRRSSIRKPRISTRKGYLAFTDQDLEDVVNHVERFRHLPLYCKEVWQPFADKHPHHPLKGWQEYARRNKDAIDRALEHRKSRNESGVSSTSSARKRAASSTLSPDIPPSQRQRMMG